MVYNITYIDDQLAWPDYLSNGHFLAAAPRGVLEVRGLGVSTLVAILVAGPGVVGVGEERQRTETSGSRREVSRGGSGDLVSPLGLLVLLALPVLPVLTSAAEL